MGRNYFVKKYYDMKYYESGNHVFELLLGRKKCQWANDVWTLDKVGAFI